MSLKMRLSLRDQQEYVLRYKYVGQREAEAWARGRLKLERFTPRRPPKREPRRVRHEPDDAPLVGQGATDAAARIIGKTWRESLGVAYPLVLLLVKSSLEAGHRRLSGDANLYHCCTTYWSLGILCAALVGKDTPFCTKTIQRWLSPTAPHAAALRCWIGRKAWTTDTLRRFETNEAGKLEDVGSWGPRVGATVFRVYLNPLSRYQQQHSEAGGVVPLACELRREWRDLDEERKGGRTARTCVSDMHEMGVRINEKRTKDCKEVGLAFFDSSNSHGDRSHVITQQQYIYPDIHTVAGAKQLTDDVNSCVESILKALGAPHDKSHLAVWRKAVWTCVKADVVGGTKEGFALLRQGLQYVKETQADEAYKREAQQKFKPVRDYSAYLMAYLNTRTFDALRRDYGEVRLFKRGIAHGVIAPREPSPPLKT